MLSVLVVVGVVGVIGAVGVVVLGLGGGRLLLPTECPVCRRAGPAPCTECEVDLRPAPSMAAPPGVDAVHAVLAYEDAGRRAGRSAQVPQRPEHGGVAGRTNGGAGGRRGRGVRPARPCGPRRGLGRRGCPRPPNAAATAASTRPNCWPGRWPVGFGVPCRRVLARGPGPPQTGRSQVERRRGPPLVADGGAPAHGGARRRRGHHRLDGQGGGRGPPRRRGRTRRGRGRGPDALPDAHGWRLVTRPGTYRAGSGYAAGAPMSIKEGRV